MTHFGRAVYLLVSAIGFWTAGALGASGPSCALVEIEGKVQVARQGSADWNNASPGEVLQIGDRLRTGSRSRATLRWSELSVARIGELTTLEVQPPATSSDKPQLELRSGRTYFFSREKPTEIQFRTPVASGAIRGTEFNLEVSEDGATRLALLDGAVDLANAQGNATLASGEQASVQPGGPPVKSPVLNAINVVQWALYYPAVLDPDELRFSDAEKESLKSSLEAYRAGDLLAALSNYPEGRQPGSDAERVWQAGLLLTVGKVEQTENLLKEVRQQSEPVAALRELIAAVKHQDLGELKAPSTGSEWVARSYYLQSRGLLVEALNAARSATELSPRFGAAWVRVAVLEFSFGRTDAAHKALTHGLELSPRNAEGLALQGFVLAAKGDLTEAERAFDRAIAADGAMANAWLGRGLVKIRRGMDRPFFDVGSPANAPGRADLQVAATLEPQRSILRSYLGKAFTQEHDFQHARKELDLAVKLDPNDPTGWLYMALLDQKANRLNEAVSDLEKSKELNDNRSVFRSRFLLDQDQAVRSANLAAIYRDEGMFDTSVQEASRAVNEDYGNYSAHLFLANSYDALRDPKLINLRYETPWFSELLVANLLAPVQGGSLSQNVSQQEYSKLFASDGLGLFSSTEYGSHGDWYQKASQYGVIGNSSYSLDAFYLSLNGFRTNNDLEQKEFDLRFKQGFTEKDSIFLEVGYFNSTSGDVAQYYNQNSASATLHVEEKQEPSLLAGYHREWAPGSHTLALFTRFDDTLTLNDSAPALLAQITSVSPFTGETNVFVQNPSFYSVNFRRELTAYSGELQQIWEHHTLTFIAGGRYQNGTADTTDNLLRSPPLGDKTPVDIKNTTDLWRTSIYGYTQWQPLDELYFIAGVSYDQLHFPVNIDTSPISDKEASSEQVSPKVGVVWSPLKDTHLRAAYSRSLGGAFFDTSVRLEPTQLAGFNDAFRSLIPESVAGLVPGTKFETWGVGLDQRFKTGTFITVQGEILKSDADRTVGILTNSDQAVPIPDSASSAGQTLDYKEQSLLASFNQLLSKEWALGARYKLTHAELNTEFPGIPPTLFGASSLHQDVSAYLNQLDLFVLYQHRCGFFAQFDAIWSQQSNQGYTPDIPGDDFWQYNVFLGYRFWQRRVEARVGFLNLSDRDYRLNPLTLYNELPRERMVTASLKLNF